MTRFGLVALSTLLVNSLFLAFETEVVEIYYLAAAILAVQGSTLWNFGFMELWVFADRREKQGTGHRLASFYLTNNVALALRGPMIYLLTSRLGVHYLASNLLSLLALTLLRYALADHWIWKSPGAG